MPKRSSALLSLLLVLFLLASYLLCHAEQHRGAGRTLRYRITSRGLGVGDMKTVLTPVQHAGGRAVRFESDLAIDANLLLYKVSSRSSEQAVIGEHGTLSYRRQGEENGRSSTVDAVLEGDAFRFNLRENGESRTVTVPRSGYDFTTMDCPETTMQREGETMEVRLLDLERAKVVKRRLHWVKSEEIGIDGRRLRCRVIDFSDPDNSCRRWVSKEGGVVIVRQDGKGKSGNYSLRMTSLQESPS